MDVGADNDCGINPTKIYITYLMEFTEPQRTRYNGPGAKTI